MTYFDDAENKDPVNELDFKGLKNNSIDEITGNHSDENDLWE